MIEKDLSVIQFCFYGTVITNLASTFLLIKDRKNNYIKSSEFSSATYTFALLIANF